MYVYLHQIFYTTTQSEGCVLDECTCDFNVWCIFNDYDFVHSHEIFVQKRCDDGTNKINTNNYNEGLEDALRAVGGMLLYNSYIHDNRRR